MSVVSVWPSGAFGISLFAASLYALCISEPVIPVELKPFGRLAYHIAYAPPPAVRHPNHFQRRISEGYRVHHLLDDARHVQSAELLGKHFRRFLFPPAFPARRAEPRRLRLPQNTARSIRSQDGRPLKVPEAR
jgi:hypothetical protein